MKKLRSQEEIISTWKGDLNEPFVSICCTTFNHDKFISQAIEGFLIQETDFPFEIIIRDDCSTDNTAEIVRSYAENYPKLIKPIFEKENQFSKGIKPMLEVYRRANGEYFALCEGDDYWTDKNKLQTQVNELLKHPKYKLSFHLCSQLLNDGALVMPKMMKLKKFYSVQDVISGHFHLLQTNTLVFRRDALDNLNMNLFKNSPVGDVWTRIAAAIPHGAIYINRDMSVYRVQGHGSWTASMVDGRKFLTFVTQMLKSIDDFDLDWKFKYTNEFQVYKNRFIKSIYKNSRISVAERAMFLDRNSSFVTVMDKFCWNFFYKHLSLISFLRQVRKLLVNEKN